ncbi:hypothetical protein SY83_09395 [Paenibacillus swuensis]|uniref:Uncharacterized protein n=1 Tax=Paenibacillus swuensis TaxID=1178515 RepID=A0A172TI44_9BACL|nr:NAD-binding protein [Paenibacillus swuensis]ANE46453.1 hypothetical protein SY83_09395 [Paenibacillus swuensis]
MNLISEFRYLDFRNYRQVRIAWVMFSIISAVIALVSGFYGFHYEAHYNLAQSIHSTLRLFIFDFDMPLNAAAPFMLELARWSAATTVLSSLLYIILTSSYHYLRFFFLRYRYNRTVIVGLNKYSLELTMELLSKHKNVCVIDYDGHPSYIATAVRQGAVVISGHLYDVKNLQSACIHRAKHIVLFSLEDSTNIETLLQITSYFNKVKMPRQPIKVKVHLKQFAFDDMLDAIQRDNQATYELHSFNVYENAIRVLFNKYPFYENTTVEQGSRCPHLLIVGFGHSGEHVFIQAAKLAHFPRQEKMKISILDCNSNEYKEVAQQKYAQLLTMFDVKFIEANALSYPFELLEPPTYIVVSTNHDMDNISIAMRLKATFAETNVYTKMSSDAGLSPWLDANQNLYSRLHTFSLGRDVISEEVILEDKLEQFGRKIHELYCDIASDATSWNQEALFSRMSNISQADHYNVKLRALGLKYTTQKEHALTKDEVLHLFIQHSEVLAISEHNRWRAYHYLYGWKPAVMNQLKDSNLKLHPALVEWDQLSERYKQYNREFVNKMYEVIEHAKYFIVRI